MKPVLFLAACCGLALTAASAAADDGPRALEVPKEPAKDVAKAPLPAPTLAMVRRSVDKKSLEVQRLVPEYRTSTYNVTVPVVRTTLVDGKPVEKTEFVTELRAKAEMIYRPVVESIALDGAEVRTAGGKTFKADEAADAVGGEFQPVIVARREYAVAEGVATAKTEVFDPVFLKMLKPETLVVVLPPAPLEPPRAIPVRAGLAPAGPAVLVPLAPKVPAESLPK